MDEEYHVEKYYFHGKPAEFGREVKNLILADARDRPPRHYTTTRDYAPYRSYLVHLLNRERNTFVGRIETRRDQDRTVLIVSWPVRLTDIARAAWEELRADLIGLEWQINPVRPPPPTDAVFDEYYRRRESGQKVTIKDMAEETGRSADYLRRVKRDYDRRTGRAKSKSTRGRET